MKSLATLAVCCGLFLAAAGMACGGTAAMGTYYGSSRGPIISAPYWKVPDLTEEARSRRGPTVDLTADTERVKAYRNVEMRVRPVEDRTPFRPYPLTYPRRYRAEMQELRSSASYPRTTETYLTSSPSSPNGMQNSPMNRISVMEYPGVMERHGTPSADYLR